MSPIYFALILMAIALGLIFFELLLPSAGILGILAFLTMLSSIGWAYYYCGLATGTIFLGAAVFAMPVILGLAVKYWPHTPIGKLVLLNTPANTEEEEAEKEHLARLVGKLGVATCTLLPGGYADIEGESWNVVSESGAIESGEKIEVVEVDGTRIVVVRAEDQSVSPAATADNSDENTFTQSLDSLGIDSFEDPFA